MTHSFTQKRAWLLFTITAVVYAATLTRNYYWDGIHFALTIEKAPVLNTTLLHPNHLVYTLVGYFVCQACELVLPGVRAMFVLQYLNCVAAAVAAVLIFRILERIFRNASPAFWLSLIFAFSATWWKFATDADAYILSVVFLLAAFLYVMPGVKPRPLLVAGLLIAAMCFHELAILFVPAGVVGIYLQSGERKVRNILLYAATAGVGIFLVYCAAFWWMTGGLDISKLIVWASSNSAETGFGFEAGRNLSYTLGGQFKLFVGGRFGSIKDIHPLLAYPLLAALLLAFIALAISILTYRKRDRNTEEDPIRTKSSVAIPAAVWAGVYLIFLTVWEPQHTFYRLFYFPAIIILIGVWLRRFDLNALSRRILPLSAAVIATANVLFFIIPYTQVRPGTPLSLAYEMRDAWPAGTVVLYKAPNSDLELIEYFNRGTEWRKAGAGELDSPPAGASDVWIDDGLAKDAGHEWLLSNTAGERGIGDPYNIRFFKMKK